MEPQLPRNENETSRKHSIAQENIQPGPSNRETSEDVSRNNNSVANEEASSNIVERDEAIEDISHSQEDENENVELDENVEVDENHTDIRQFVISYRAFHSLMIELDESAYYEKRLNEKHEIIESDMFDFLGELAYRRGEETEELKRKKEIDQLLKNVEDESIDDSGDENLRENENINKLSEDAENTSKLVEVSVNSNNDKIDSQDLQSLKMIHSLEEAAVNENHDQMNDQNSKKLKVMDTLLNDDDKKVNEEVSALDALLSVVMEDSLYQNMEQNVVQTNDQ